MTVTNRYGMHRKWESFHVSFLDIKDLIGLNDRLVASYNHVVPKSYNISQFKYCNLKLDCRRHILNQMWPQSDIISNVCELV